MLRYTLIIAFLALTCACGGGKSSSPKSGESEIPVDTGKRFKLGGVVAGLNGNIVIANGTETLTISSAGNFQFLKTIADGELYDVKIVALPTNQLCELRNAKNYAYRDHLDVIVECANLTEKTVKISLPEKLKLTDLRLLSNYQAKGGVGEDPLDNLSSKLIVYDNSVISLRNASNKTLYLSYLGHITADTIELNSRTTAIALMLLEPAVISAIQDRGLLIADMAPLLAEGVNLHGENENGKLDVLADEIEALIESKKDLTAPTPALIDALGEVLNAATNIIIKAAPLTITSQASAASTAEDLGVNFVFSKAGASSTKVALTATNQRSRYLSLGSTRFTSTTPLVIAPFATQSIALNSSQTAQDSFSVSIAAPGVKGDLSEAKINNVLAASVASGLNQFFLPSVSVILGLKNPSEFSLADCLSDNSLAALGEQTAPDQEILKTNLRSDLYYKLFSNISSSARSKFLIAEKTTGKIPLKEIFDCEKFGSGLVISSKKAIAIDSTTGVINVVNAMFSPGNISLLPNLYASEKLSYLSEAIRTNYAEKEWNLSTSLQLNVSTTSNRVAVGSSVDFSSLCQDPSNKQLVNCAVTWDFGNTTTGAGSSAANVFTTVGQYIVTATAVSDLGVKQTQSITVDVLPLKPDIAIKLAETTLVANGTATKFGHSDVATSKSLAFTLVNTGFAPLNIYSITSSDANFKIEAATTTNQLAIGASAKFNVIFSPTAATTYASDINVTTDDPDQATFTFKVEGSSVGHWLVKKGSSEKSFTAVRYKVLDQGAAGLQIRLFGSVNEDYPQIRLALKNYDANIDSKTYSLDDIADSNEVCLAFFAEADSSTKQYCTTKPLVSDVSSTKNQVTFSNIAILTLTKKAVFEFNAVSRDCANLATSCDIIHISGEARY